MHGLYLNLISIFLYVEEVASVVAQLLFYTTSKQYNTKSQLKQYKEQRCNLLAESWYNCYSTDLPSKTYAARPASS